MVPTNYQSISNYISRKARKVVAKARILTHLPLNFNRGAVSTPHVSRDAFSAL